MKKEIRVVDEKKKIIQVTTVGERWYYKEVENDKGDKETQFVPSVTWICDHYPKGVQFYKWLASKGWDEAEAIKTSAGDRGSRVHKAIQDLLDGKEVMIDAKYPSGDEGEPKELTFEEYDAVLSFARRYQETKPTVLDYEFNVWGDGYAGTVDLFCEIDGQLWIVDFKTSASIWPSMELQLSAYKKAMTDNGDVKLAILQVGYKLNKKRFKFTEIDEQFNEFLAAKLIWAKEQKDVFPKQRDYPMSVKLENNEKEK